MNSVGLSHYARCSCGLSQGPKKATPADTSGGDCVLAWFSHADTDSDAATFIQASTVIGFQWPLNLTGHTREWPVFDNHPTNPNPSHSTSQGTPENDRFSTTTQLTLTLNTQPHGSHEGVIGFSTTTQPHRLYTWEWSVFQQPLN